jgi:2'-5' RNA ligase
MRTFIAIELPSELKEKVDNAISALEDADFCDAKWVSEKKLHLTLKFLGEINREQVEKVKTALLAITRGTKSFTIQLEGLGHFNQRVLWMGGNSDNQAESLANKIDSELGKLGFPKDGREFSIHLTLARIKKVYNWAKMKQLLEENEAKDFGSFKVDKIKFIESILSAEGHTYKTIAEFNLI